MVGTLDIIHNDGDPSISPARLVSLGRIEVVEQEWVGHQPVCCIRL